MTKTLMEQSFHVLDVSRNDLEMLGYDASNINDDDMKVLSEKLNEELIEYFFQDLEHLAEEVFDIPRLNQVNN